MVNLLLFLSMAIGGVLLEIIVMKAHYLISKSHYKEHHFTYRKYIFFLSFPLIAALVIVQREGLSVINVFITFAVLGTFLEWFIGYGYHKILGQRLWTYHRYGLTKYTSLLSIPIWGLAGILFWLLVKAFG